MICMLCSVTYLICEDARGNEEMISLFLDKENLELVGQGAFKKVYRLKSTVRAKPTYFEMVVKDISANNIPIVFQGIENNAICAVKAADIFKSDNRCYTSDYSTLELLFSQVQNGQYNDQIANFQGGFLKEVVKLEGEVKKEIDIGNIVSRRGFEYRYIEPVYNNLLCYRVRPYRYLIFEFFLSGFLYERQDPRASLSSNIGLRNQSYLTLFRQVLFIHKKKVVHCDLKPDNALWNDNTKTHIIITDYGISEEQQQPTDPAFCRGGTPGYAGPEMLLGVQSVLRVDSTTDINYQNYRYASDVYSLGVMLAEMELSLPGDPFRFSSVVVSHYFDSQNQRKFVSQTDHDNIINILSNRFQSLKNKPETFRVEPSDRYGGRTSTEIPIFNLPEAQEVYMEALEQLLKDMLKYNMNERITLDQAHCQLWLIYQLASRSIVNNLSALIMQMFYLAEYAKTVGSCLDLVQARNDDEMTLLSIVSSLTASQMPNQDQINWFKNKMILGRTFGQEYSPIGMTVKEYLQKSWDEQARQSQQNFQNLLTPSSNLGGNFQSGNIGGQLQGSYAPNNFNTQGAFGSHQNSLQQPFSTNNQAFGSNYLQPTNQLSYQQFNSQNNFGGNSQSQFGSTGGSAIIGGYLGNSEGYPNLGSPFMNSEVHHQAQRLFI